jgi:hypothetical protein
LAGFGMKRPTARLLTTKVDHDKDRREPTMPDAL